MRIRENPGTGDALLDAVGEIYRKHTNLSESEFDVDVLISELQVAIQPHIKPRKHIISVSPTLSVEPVEPGSRLTVIVPMDDQYYDEDYQEWAT